MINLVDFMATLFYLTLIILVIVLIILTIKAIKTLIKVDKVIDDINEKSSKLDGVFNIIDTTTSVALDMSDALATFIKSGIENIFRKRDKDE